MQTLLCLFLKVQVSIYKTTFILEFLFYAELALLLFVEMLNASLFFLYLADGDRVSQYEIKMMDLDREHLGIPVSIFH